MAEELSVLVLITLAAAIVNGALGHGFSSITVPVALLFYTSRILNPALVLLEVGINTSIVLMSRSSLPAVGKRVVPIVLGLVPGIVVGSLLLPRVNAEWLKLFVYALLLPLILLQAAGIRKPVRLTPTVGAPFGTSLGILYSLTTISGPPLALLFNGQGLAKHDFRVAVGLPIGALLIRRLDAEVFRRLCMSFDAWIVGFGLSKVLVTLGLVLSPWAYLVWTLVVILDLALLTAFFGGRRLAPSLSPIQE